MMLISNQQEKENAALSFHLSLNAEWVKKYPAETEYAKTNNTKIELVEGKFDQIWVFRLLRPQISFSKGADKHVDIRESVLLPTLQGFHDRLPDLAFLLPGLCVILPRIFCNCNALVESLPDKDLEVSYVVRVAI